MLYTLAEVAKATDLPERTILSAIESGQITGFEDLFGKWHVEDTELRRLCYLMMERNSSRDVPCDYEVAGATSSQAEIGALVTEVGERLREQRDNRLGHRHLHTGDDQAPTLQNLLAEANRGETAAQGPASEVQEQPTVPWDHDLRMDDRDKILVSSSPPFIRRTRFLLKTIALLVTLSIGWFGGFSSSYFLSFRPFPTPEQKINPSAQVLGSENQLTPIASTETPPAVIPQPSNIEKSATAPGNGIAHRDKSTQSTDQITRSIKGSAIEQPNASLSGTASAAITRSTKTLSKPMPVPETRPTTIEGWRVRDVVDGTAILEGPNGIRKAARGDIVPGLGRIDSIVLWGSRWIVSTSRGLISTQ
jgi:hypothetical protein